MVLYFPNLQSQNIYDGLQGLTQPILLEPPSTTHLVLLQYQFSLLEFCSSHTGLRVIPQKYLIYLAFAVAYTWKDHQSIIMTNFVSLKCLLQCLQLSKTCLDQSF